MRISYFVFSFLLIFKLYAKSFIYCSEGSPSSFNPQITTDGTSNNAATHTIYNRLVEFEYGTTNIIPRLAQSWEISKDKKVYTFRLRKGVKFHKTKYFTPTRDFNADDVIFSFERQLRKDHPYHMIGGGQYVYFQDMGMNETIKEIKKIDDYTVQFLLTQPLAPFLANLAMGFASILSDEYAHYLISKNKQNDIDNFPIGTGPYIFQKYVKDSMIRYTANEEYFVGVPKISKLIFSITTDPNVRYQKLKTEECHLAIEPSPNDLPQMKTNKGLKVLESPGLNISYLAINSKIKPLDNIFVRRAINHALNTKSYIEAIYLGHAIEAKNPIPPTMWAYYNENLKLEYNPEKAKQLLAKAGYKDGFETELLILPVTRPYNPNGKKMGEMMQADLAKVGIKVKLINYDWPTYLTKSRQGIHGLIQGGWTGDNGDPDNFMDILLGCNGVNAGSNMAQWCDKKYSDLMAKAKIVTSKDERKNLYIQAQKIFTKESPWAPIAHSIVFRAMSAKVDGYKMDPLGNDIFTYVDLK
ncbi:MAG: ABC transporter substrate-binding protein [Halobacteriovoraceae bacterium]|nr:ABC transporter substrate-binding protein [Halobacteriovoraceae bacterium]